MSFLYLTEPGAMLHLKQGKLIVKKDDKIISEISKDTVEGVVLTGRVNATSAVFTDFLERGVPVTWLGGSGKFYGRLDNTQKINVARQLQQIKLQDSTFYFELQKKIVYAKTMNQLKIIRGLHRRKELPETAQAIWDMSLIIKKIQEATSTLELMGYEGATAKIYFSAISDILPEDFKFAERTRRPPKDPFNSLLNFGYHLLFSEIYTAVQLEGLHPYFGFFHKLKEHHPALVSDLMEEWRAVIVDSMALSIVNKREIHISDFTTGEGDGVFLTKEGRKAFLRAYEKKIRSSVENYSYRHHIASQARNFAIALMAEDAEKYVPFRMK